MKSIYYFWGNKMSLEMQTGWGVNVWEVSVNIGCFYFTMAFVKLPLHFNFPHYFLNKHMTFIRPIQTINLKRKVANNLLEYFIFLKK